MLAEIISIGEELLSGDKEIIDTNSIFITKALRAIGVGVTYKTTVGDHIQRITDVVRAALARADVIITSGGLGPTVDDMTRQGIADAVGVPLVFDDMLMEGIAEKFRKFGVRMSDNNRLQAYLPQGAAALDNAVGTAPGFVTEVTLDGVSKAIYSVPGVPREMRYLVERHIIPHIRHKFGITGIIRTRVLRTAGIGESMLDEQIGDLEKSENPQVGLAAHTGQVDIRIYARAETDEEVNALIATMEAEMRRRIGQYIFGVENDPLRLAFLSLLSEQGLKLAVGEHGTFDRFRALIGDQPEDGATITYESDLAPLVADQGLKSLKDTATATAEALRLKHSADLSVVLITRDSETAIGLSNGDEQRGRGYAYGNANDDNSPTQTAEWAAQWGLSMAWWLAKSTAMKRAGQGGS